MFNERFEKNIYDRNERPGGGGKPADITDLADFTSKKPRPAFPKHTSRLEKAQKEVEAFTGLTPTDIADYQLDVFPQDQTRDFFHPLKVVETVVKFGTGPARCGINGLSKAINIIRK